MFWESNVSLAILILASQVRAVKAHLCLGYWIQDKMSLVLRQDPLQTLSYTLFELTGEKLYELFLFFTRNPYVTRFVRQVRIVIYVMHASRVSITSIEGSD